MKPIPVNVHLANTIAKMKEELTAQFGCDFAFTIMGHGHFVSTHNYRQGIILPTIKEDVLNGIMARAKQ